MVVEDGEWRIADAPDALIVPRGVVRAAVPPGLALLLRPDRADPGARSRSSCRAATSWPRSLVHGLLAGPGRRPARVVRTLVPPGLRVGLSVPVTRRASPRSRLDGDAATRSTSDAAELMLAQLAWTLRPGARRSARSGSPSTARRLALPGGASTVPVDAGRRVRPDRPRASSADSSGCATAGWSRGTRTLRAVTRARSARRGYGLALGRRSTSPRHPVAGVSADGSAVLVGAGRTSRTRRAPVVSGATDLLPPGLGLRRPAVAGRPHRRPAPGSPWSTGGQARAVRVPGVTRPRRAAFLVSRDGSRLVAVVRRPGGDRRRGRAGSATTARAGCSARPGPARSPGEPTTRPRILDIGWRIRRLVAVLTASPTTCPRCARSRSTASPRPVLDRRSATRAGPGPRAWSARPATSRRRCTPSTGAASLDLLQRRPARRPARAACTSLDLRRLSRPPQAATGRGCPVADAGAAPRMAGCSSRAATPALDLLLGSSCVGCGGPGRLLCPALPAALPPRRPRRPGPTPGAGRAGAAVGGRGVRRRVRAPGASPTRSAALLALRRAARPALPGAAVRGRRRPARPRTARCCWCPVPVAAGRRAGRAATTRLRAVDRRAARLLRAAGADVVVAPLLRSRGGRASTRPGSTRRAGGQPGRVDVLPVAGAAAARRAACRGPASWSATTCSPPARPRARRSGRWRRSGSRSSAVAAVAATRRRRRRGRTAAGEFGARLPSRPGDGLASVSWSPSGSVVASSGRLARARRSGRQADASRRRNGPRKAAGRPALRDSRSRCGLEVSPASPRRQMRRPPGEGQ